MLDRIAGLVVVAYLLVVSARGADACGFWKMRDTEKTFEINWLINSGTITNKAKKRVAALYLDDQAKGGLKVVTSRKTIYDVKDGKIRKYGKPVGSIDAAGSIVFGKKTYTVAFSDQKPLHDFPSWTLTVKRGADLIIESTEASALCAAAHRAQTGGTMSDDEQQAEIRLRVAYYLAWREVGF